MVSLKELEAWCYYQIDLMNRLYDVEDFPGEVEFCRPVPAEEKRIHIRRGIEHIGAALKVPVKINTYTDNFFEKSVTHQGVQFFQLNHYSKI